MSTPAFSSELRRAEPEGCEEGMSISRESEMKREGGGARWCFSIQRRRLTQVQMRRAQTREILRCAQDDSKKRTTSSCGCEESAQREPDQSS